MTDRNPAKGRRDDPKSAAANLDDTSAGGGPADSFSGLGSPERDTASPRPVGSRRDRYLVAAVGGGLPPGVAPFGTLSPFGATAPSGVDPAFADNLFAQLEADPATIVHRVI